MMREMVGGCCVCSDERGWADNPLVYCDGHGCNVAVHQACYGIIAVPTGPWFCRKCESQERAARVRCELCPQKEGALKKTDTQGWCHVLCALYIPEAWFGNVQTMEPIVLKGVPAERFNKLCYICEENGRVGKATTGACMQCNKSGCKQYFHVTCAQSQGLLCEESGSYMDNVRYCGYCKYHYKKLKKDSHLKVIPAFKSVVSEVGSTPESSPEKAPSLQARLEHQKVRERPAKGAASNSSPSASATTSVSSPSDIIDATAPNSNGGSASAGKFTTANFVETTITPSPASFKQGHNKSDKPDNSGSDTDCSRSESPDSSGSSSSSDSDSEGESSHPKSKTKSDTKETSSVKSALAGGQANADSKKLAKNGAASVAVSSGAATTTAGGVIITPPAPPSYSYCFENFLQRNYSGTQAPQSVAQKSTTPPPPPADETEGKPRNINKTTEKGEKKKAKKSKSLPSQTMVNGRGKGAKEASALDLSAQSPPLGGATGPAKKATTAPAKRKRAASRSESGKSTVKASKLTTPTATARQTSAKKAAPIKDSKLGNLSSNPFATVSTASNTATTGASPAATRVFSDSVVARTGMVASTTSSSGLLGKTAIAASAVSAKRENMIHQLPSSMEQLLERHWEQGNQFLIEQGQHFDLASLLDCLQQLRQENMRLEENISTLSTRRDQLLAVNARLAHTPSPNNPPLGPAGNPLSSLTRGLGIHSRSPRVNSMMGHDDTNSTQDLSQPWSPMLGQSPLQNSPGSQTSRSSSLHHTPEKHTPVTKPTSHTPPKLAPPSGSPGRVPVADHKWLVQNLPGMRGQAFPPRIEQPSMYQMLQQHRSLPYSPSATSAGIAVTTGMSSVAKTTAYAMLSQSIAMAAGKNDTQSTENT